MKATCKTCQSTYLHNERWIGDECPMCLIEAVERSTDWVCVDDFPEFIPTEDSKWFYVYRKEGKLEVISRKQARRKGRLPATPIFSGKLDACINFIKKRYDREASEGI